MCVVSFAPTRCTPMYAVAAAGRTFGKVAFRRLFHSAAPHFAFLHHNTHHRLSEMFAEQKDFLLTKGKEIPLIKRGFWLFWT